MQLTIRDLSQTYPNGARALKGVSLSVPSGMYGLLGPGGAGKSTLLRILATLQEADGGSAMLGEIDVLRHRDDLRRTLGYLPQVPDPLPNVAAQDLLDHFALLRGCTRHGERRAMVEALLQQADLWDVRRHKLGGYSIGMRQRFGVAVALLGNPQLMIADEPGTGIGPTERARFLDLLATLAGQRVVILATRNVDDVSRLCTRMAIIESGRILLEGEPQPDLKQVYASTIAAQLGCRPGDAEPVAA